MPLYVEPALVEHRLDRPGSPASTQPEARCDDRGVQVASRDRRRLGARDGSSRWSRSCSRTRTVGPARRSPTTSHGPGCERSSTNCCRRTSSSSKLQNRRVNERRRALGENVNRQKRALLIQARSRLRDRLRTACQPSASPVAPASRGTRARSDRIGSSVAEARQALRDCAVRSGEHRRSGPGQARRGGDRSGCEVRDRASQEAGRACGARTSRPSSLAAPGAN